MEPPQSPEAKPEATPEATPQINSQDVFTVSNLQDTSRHPTLWYRIHVLLFDLQHFNQRPDSKERLENVVDPSYIGAPYFTAEEAIVVKNTRIRDKILSEIIENELNERLNRRNKKRVESGDYRVCAAHDLAPIIGSSLAIDLKRLEKDKTFLRLLNTKGLELGGEGWSGLTAKSFAPKSKGKRKR